MTRSSMKQLFKIDNENDARKFAERCMEEYRNDPEMKNYSAKECFESDLRWLFGDEDGGMPFDKIAMWSKVAVDL
jgi:hypothetical protein